MPFVRQAHFTLLSLVIVTVIAAGCAKRPAAETTTVPAPTGLAGAMPQAGAAQPTAAGTPTPAPGAPVTPDRPGAPRDGTAATRPPVPTPRPSPREFTAIPELRDVHFDFDSYDIRPDDARILEENARWMKANPDHLILIEGHADERGTNEYNLVLGERRAKAAMNYLVAQGVVAGRLTLISYGEERPVCSEKTEACWARNRRAHFLVKPR